MASRLTYFCEYCKASGPRNYFPHGSFIPLDDEVPGYLDLCPRCGDDDITVVDEDAAERAAPKPWVDYGDGDGEEPKD